MKCCGRERGLPPAIGAWTETSCTKPPSGQWVLGWWGENDIEAVQYFDHPRWENGVWEARSGDTATPAAWATITEEDE